MSISQQNPDGSWSPAEPLGWQGGPYWEVYADRAELVGPDSTLAVVRSRWRWLLRLKMIAASLWRYRQLRREAVLRGPGLVAALERRLR